MIAGRKVLAVIPARGGSKGLPRKNIIELGGKPLIAWTVEAAKSSSYIDRVVLSSEDREIIETASALGCEIPFVRDAALATDEATGTAVLLDAIERLPGFDYVVLLQPTSPLRTAADIDDCIRRCATTGAPVCVTITPLSKPAEWLLSLNDDGTISSLIDRELPDRRQDATPVFAPNGAVFVARTAALQASGTLYGRDTVGHVMPAERSVDIDTPFDLEIARALIAQSPV